VDLRDEGDGTAPFLGTLELWIARVGPVKFQSWQSAYFASVRKGFSDTEAFEGESRASRAKRIKDMYEAVQTGIHGDDHVFQAVRKGQGGVSREGTELRQKGARPLSQTPRERITSVELKCSFDVARNG
jgi:hypothetical protein